MGTPSRVAAAGGVTVLSGAVMMLAGYLLRTDGWAVATAVMTPGGLLMSVAFRMVDGGRPGGSRHGGGTPSPAGASAGLVVLAGLPWPTGDLPLPSRLAASGLTLLAGAVMALAGYAGAAWSWLWAPPIVAVGGFLAGAAVTLTVLAPHRRRRTDQEIVQR